MSPITAQEAYDLTNPNATEESRQQAAANIAAGVAANDAYLNSRGELEQLALRARGDQHPPSFTEQNQSNAADALPAHDVEGTAIEDTGGAQLPAGSAPDVATEAEITALKARIAQLEEKGA